MSATDDDRRAHPRVPYGAWVTVTQGAAKTFYLARNLSLGGVFLRADELLPLDTQVHVVLVVEGDHDPISVDGYVARHSEAEGGFGVRFDAMGDSAAARLLDLVQDTVRQLAAALKATIP